jgi:hypothetical protein
MIKWVLIIYITADLPLPLTAYNTEAECYAALAEWEFQPGVHGTCLEGTVEPPEKKRRRRHG